MAGQARPAVLALGAALLATAAIVGLGTATADEEAAPDESFRTTSLADYDTSTVVIGREDFCEDVDPRQVEAALVAEPETERTWANGDRIKLPSGGRDVIHEYGCEYAAADGTTARAWVFAPPVDTRRAKRLMRAAGRKPRCAVVDGPAFGTPSLGLDCVTASGRTVSYMGLFGDAWLTCELAAVDPAADPAELVERAGAWCVGVATAASS